MRILSLVLAVCLVLGTITYAVADDAVVAEWIPVQGEGYVPAHLVLGK